jgi:hypothetical protein
MSQDDLKMIKVVDTVQEVIQVLEPHIEVFQKLHAKQLEGN